MASASRNLPFRFSYDLAYRRCATASLCRRIPASLRISSLFLSLLSCFCVFQVYVKPSLAFRPMVDISFEICTMEELKIIRRYVSSEEKPTRVPLLSLKRTCDVICFVPASAELRILSFSFNRITFNFTRLSALLSPRLKQQRRKAFTLRECSMFIISKFGRYSI